jgi:exosortase
MTTETPAAEKQPEPSLLDEAAAYWRQWPNKGIWFGLAAAWVLLFQFLGNSTFGYIDTGSLFSWMHYAYTHAPDDEHGFLIPLIVLVLFWWKREELLRAVGVPWWPALGLVALALGFHVIAYLIQQTRISIFAFYFGLYGLMGLVWGPGFLKASLFPMVLCVFAVPISTVSQWITYPLRILVTQISVGIGHGILGMPIWREGSQIISSELGPMYDVAPACSGIRSLTAMGAITMIYAFMAFRVPWKRLLILLAAFPLAVTGNVARVSTVMVLGDVFGREQAMRLEQYLGMVTFIVALGCLLLVGRALKSDSAQSPDSDKLKTVGTVFLPLGPRPWPALAVTLVLLAGTGVALGRIGSEQHLGKPGLVLRANAAADRTQGVWLPEQVLEFSSKTQEVTEVELNWLPKDTTFGRRGYVSSKDGFEVALSVVLMGTDRTSIHKPQYCLDGQGWRIQTTETAVVPINRPYPYDLKVMKLTTAPRQFTENGRTFTARGIYVYWFVAENELTPYHGERMWWMARDLIRTGVLQRWAYVAYFTACPPGMEEATFTRLKEFIAASVPQFQLAAGPRLSVGQTAAVRSEHPAQN